MDLEHLTRLFRDLLAVAEVAGLVIGDLARGARDSGLRRPIRSSNSWTSLSLADQAVARSR